MSKSKKLSATSEQIDNTFGVIERALRSTGRLLSEDEDDVRRSELSIDVESVALPNLLQDPMATLARGRDVLESGLSRYLSRTDTVFDETQQNLKRAARNGRLISDKIQTRMSTDRVAAIKKIKKV